MNRNDAPEAVVQRQLEAYNARDLDAWLATYAHNAQQFEHPAKLVASGHAEIRARAAARFTEPNLHARLIQRCVMGTIVIDEEEITRTFPEGTGRVGLVCIYDVRDGKIRTGSFVFGEKTLDAD
jgi:putative hydrolase of HD superfamily